MHNEDDMTAMDWPYPIHATTTLSQAAAPNDFNLTKLARLGGLDRFANLKPQPSEMFCAVPPRQPARFWKALAA